MPTAIAPNPRAGTPEDIDDLFNYDAGVAEMNPSTNMDQDQGGLAGRGKIAQPAPNMDEEIKVTRQRQPLAKLDEERILSRSGIPKLRKISKTMKFKGKGHEFTDMARLLNTYQLWLDDLYPKAKFADGLTLVEKLGHKKRMQIMRREWIEEGKPRRTEDAEEDSAEPQMISQDVERPNAAHEERGAVQQMGYSIMGPNVSIVPTTIPQTVQSMMDGPEDDELDALLAEGVPMSNARPSLFGSGAPAISTHTESLDRNAFDDDEEAMAGMGW